MSSVTLSKLLNLSEFLWAPPKPWLTGLKTHEQMQEILTTIMILVNRNANYKFLRGEPDGVCGAEVGLVSKKGP